MLHQKPSPAASCSNPCKQQRYALRGQMLQCNARTRWRSMNPRHLQSVRAVISTDSTPGTKEASAGTVASNVVPARGLPDRHGGEADIKRPRVVVLGSGWASISFIKGLKKDSSKRYDVSLVSPRNYFLYTPLLPAVATGTVEERSIVEVVRRIIRDKGEYYEAQCTEIDVANKELVACFPDDVGMAKCCFKVAYDILVLGVGSINNTFNIKGVEEHCLSFRSITDASKLRRQVSECFERSALPDISEEVELPAKQERKQLLSFVIVGGGPTGVEVAAELNDMFESDLVKLYPKLVKDVKISVIELQDHILSTYDRRISEYTREVFTRNRIELVLNTKVKGVFADRVAVVDNEGREQEIPFGVCVWSTGVAMHPIVKQIQQKLPQGTQTHFRSIITDEHLCVKGSNGSMYAIGDAATIEQPKSLERADELFDAADTDKDGQLRLVELRDLLRSASKEYSVLEEHSRFLDAKYGQNRFGGLVRSTLQGAGGAAAAQTSPVAELTDETQLTREQFKALLAQIDKGLRALPATAQVAKQQGEYLARLLNKHDISAERQLPASLKPFRYNHKGSLAYIGTDKISFRNQCLVALDWVRTKVFGRDLSRV